MVSGNIVSAKGTINANVDHVVVFENVQSKEIYNFHNVNFRPTVASISRDAVLVFHISQM